MFTQQDTRISIPAKCMFRTGEYLAFSIIFSQNKQQLSNQPAVIKNQKGEHLGHLKCLNIIYLGCSCVINVIYIYLCIRGSTRLPYDMMFCRFNSNTTGDTSGAGASYHSGAIELIPVFSAVCIVFGFPLMSSNVWYYSLGLLVLPADCPYFQ